ncbi:MAG: hypothetical protein LBT80_08400 [Lactobacillaceae bacterium]|jgi:hypothetical protein|nr:hypothetical protein [Lactobacillaceae bacterium]
MTNNHRKLKKIILYAAILTTVGGVTTFAKYVSEPVNNNDTTLVSGFDFDVQLTRQNGSNANALAADKGKPDAKDRYGDMQTTNDTGKSVTYNVQLVNKTGSYMKLQEITLDNELGEGLFQPTNSGIRIDGQQYSDIAPHDTGVVATVTMSGSDFSKSGANFLATGNKVLNVKVAQSTGH